MRKYTRSEIITINKNARKWGKEVEAKRKKEKRKKKREMKKNGKSEWLTSK